MSSHRTSSTTMPPRQDLALLGWLAVSPLATVAELAALSGWHQASLARRLKELRSQGLVEAVRLSTPGVPTVHRHFLTAAGIRALDDQKGGAAQHLLRTRPVSRQWLRLLLSRADTLAPVYKVASWLAETAGVRAFRWYRSLPLDAAVLTGKGAVGILREGPTAPSSQFHWRVESLLRRREIGTVLVMAPDSLRLRQMRRVLDHTPLTALLAVETQVLGGSPDAALWCTPFDPAPRSFGEATRLFRGGRLPVERGRVKAALPHEALQRAAARLQKDKQRRGEHHLLPLALAARHKRALDVLARWPLATLQDLAALLGCTREAARLDLKFPIALGLVARLRLDRVPRFALSDAGLAFLARRDRLSVAAVLRRWSPSVVDARAQPTWRNLKGTRLRELARHLAHTAGVYRFFAALARQAHTQGGSLDLALPAHRARQAYRLGEGTLFLKPDGYGEYRDSDGLLHRFFLEWEQRAMHPAHFRAKLAPYLAYFSSRQPVDDFGGYPCLLFVLRDEVVESHFLGWVQRKSSVPTLPNLVILATHTALVEAKGPLGAIWRDAPGTERGTPW